MPKATRNSKHSILRDELQITKGGLYCIFPWASPDKSGRGLYKIGMAVSPMHKRMEDYHNMFPFAVNMIAFLEDPPVATIPTRKSPDVKSKTSKYIEIESFLFDYVVTHGGQRFYSYARVQGQRNKKLKDTTGKKLNDKGQTEWVYTDELTIHEAFAAAHDEFYGRLEMYSMFIDDKGKERDLQDEAAKAKKVKPNFVGEVIYPLEKTA